MFVAFGTKYIAVKLEIKLKKKKKKKETGPEVEGVSI